MKFSLTSLAFLLLFSLHAFADETNGLGCRRLHLALDPGLNAIVVERDWGSGSTRDEAPAVLELKGCDGEVLDSVPLKASLARIDPEPVRGTSAPTFLVSVDLTQDAGSFNGPLTEAFEIAHDRLKRAEAQDENGRTVPIKLTATGKSAWKREPSGKGEELLAVACEPSGKDFAIYYRTYRPGRAGWTVRVRAVPGFWESDADFPPRRDFP